MAIIQMTPTVDRIIQLDRIMELSGAHLSALRNAALAADNAYARNRTDENYEALRAAERGYNEAAASVRVAPIAELRAIISAQTAEAEELSNRACHASSDDEDCELSRAAGLASRIGDLAFAALTNHGNFLPGLHSTLDY